MQYAPFGSSQDWDGPGDTDVRRGTAKFAPDRLGSVGGDVYSHAVPERLRSAATRWQCARLSAGPFDPADQPRHPLSITKKRWALLWLPPVGTLRAFPR